MNKVAVVGSGIGGLSAALNLRAKGAEVVVFERNPWFGGKVRSFQTNGFRFDKGPSLFTLPILVDDVFRLFSKNPRDYYAYVKLEVACNYFDTDGKYIKAYTNSNHYVEEVQQKLGVEAAKELEEYLKISSRNLELSNPLFIENDKSLLSKAGLKMMLNAKNMGIFTSMNQYNVQRFSDPFLVKIFNRFATYNGSNPYECPAVLNCIPALEHGDGAYFPTGGMIAIVEALAKLAKEEGVQLNLNTEVNEVSPSENGVKVNGEVFDAVVINGDFYQTQKLLPEKYQRQLPKDSDLSSSGLVFYWGVGAEFPTLDVHNIFFANDYKEEFNNIRLGELSEDLTVYVHVSSKLVKDDAPVGKECWFVMVNTPAKEISEEKVQIIRESILIKLSKILNKDIATLIELEEVFTPQIIERDTSSYKGALYGMHSNSLSHMMSRPKNRSKIPGVYYAGGTVFPGGGIPLCMSSGKLAAQKIEEDGLVGA
jgi:phytoene desaturase